MQLYLVRHGETYLNKYNRMQGWADSPLTEKGKELARQCGQILKQYDIQHIITTDFGRTIETGREISSVLNLKKTPTIMPEFRETFFGYYEGADGNEAWEDVAKKSGFESVNDLYRNSSISEIMDYFHEADETGDAEDYQTFITRLKRGLDKVQENYASSDAVALVTHGNTIRNIAYFLDPTINCAEVLVNAGISIIEMTDGNRKLIAYNIKPN